MVESDRIASLSTRELEIARAYSGGASYREIAERLFIAPTTVRTHLQTIYRKLGVSSKVGLFQALEVDRVVNVPTNGDEAVIEFPERPSVAVLPFMCMSGDREQEFFADGLTEDIITRLSYLRGLIVIARTSTFSFKGRAVRVQDIALDLGAKFILEGSVRRAGDRVRITAQLIEGETGAHLWAQRYDRDLNDVFAVQDEIAHAIAVGMQVELTDGEIVISDPGWTTNVDAWEKFHQGVVAFLAYTSDDNLRARRLFEEALAIDPEYLDAKVYLAWTYWQDSRSGYTPDRSASLTTCRRLVDELIEAGPVTANGKHLESATLLIERRHDQALHASAEAVPTGPCKLFGYTPAALVNLYSGRFQAALDVLRTTVRLSPYTPNDSVYTIAYALSLLGDHRSAIQAAEIYLKRVPSDLYAYTLLAMTYGFSGDMDRARSTISAFRKLYPTFNLNDFSIHEFYRSTDDLNRVLAVLREAGVPD